MGITQKVSNNHSGIYALHGNDNTVFEPWVPDFEELGLWLLVRILLNCALTKKTSRQVSTSE